VKKLPWFALPFLAFMAAMVFAGRNAECTASRPHLHPENAEPAGVSLKICLRLADDRPFAGAASLRVMPDEGYELSGTPSESEGEFVFADVGLGTYIVEVSAPGFLAQRLRAHIEAASGQKTIIVMMKPKPALIATETNVTELGGSDAMRASNGSAIVSTVTAAAGSAARNPWTAHGLQEYVPPVDAGVPCSAESLLKGVGQRMVELIANLERFSAREQVEHFTVDGKKLQSAAQSLTFDYVVSVSRNASGTFMLEEYRNGRDDPDQFPAHVASLGLPGLALLFHPELARDFAFACEGLGQLEGRAAWQVHFAQRADRPVKMRSYSVNGRAFRINMEGRAWIDPGSYQVLRLESELANPIPEIGLAIEHTVIDYQLVQFRTQQVQIWLPRHAELYVDRKGHRFYRKHTFTDFRIFNVDTAQNLERPKESYSFTNLSERDIEGALAILPTDPATHGVVTLTFTVPAQGKVIKVVGVGKDVDLPVTSVGSATFTHNGMDGSIKVDVDLGRETTLEVISGSAGPH
jgi:hypothetical protein